MAEDSSNPGILIQMKKIWTWFKLFIWWLDSLIGSEFYILNSTFSYFK